MLRYAFFLILTITVFFTSCGDNTNSNTTENVIENKDTTAKITSQPDATTNLKTEETSPELDLKKYIGQSSFDLYDNEEFRTALEKALGDKKDEILGNFGAGTEDIVEIEGFGIILYGSVENEAIVYETGIICDYTGQNFFAATTNEEGKIGTYHPEKLDNVPTKFKEWIEKGSIELY